MKTSQTPSIDTEQYTSIPRAWLADIIDDTAENLANLENDIDSILSLTDPRTDPRDITAPCNFTLQTLYRAAREIKQRLEGYRRAYTDTDETDIIH